MNVGFFLLGFPNIRQFGTLTIVHRHTIVWFFAYQKARADSHGAFSDGWNATR